MFSKNWTIQIGNDGKVLSTAIMAYPVTPREGEYVVFSGHNYRVTQVQWHIAQFKIVVHTEEV